MSVKNQLVAEVWLIQAEAVVNSDTPAVAAGALSILGEVRKQRSWWDRLFNFSFNRRVRSVARRAHANLEEAGSKGNEYCAQNCLDNARAALERGDFGYAAEALERADGYINSSRGAGKSSLQSVRRSLNEKLLSGSA